MKNVLFVLQTKCAGAERMTLLYAKILQNYGYKCKLLIFSFGESNDELDPFIPQEMTYTKIHCNRNKFVFLYLIKYLIKNSIDVVFSSLPYFSFNLLLLKKTLFPKLKIIVRLANMPSAHCEKDHKNAKKFYPFADCIIAQTIEMKNEIVSYYNLPTDLIVVINNPTDKDLINTGIKESVELNPNYKNYISCGQIIPRKDLETLLWAFAKHLRDVPNSHLYILGTSNDEEYKLKLKQIVELNNMSESVFFMGFQSNPFKYINSADYFVLSSKDEGLPNVMLEAMYLGKPVIATTCIPYIKTVIQEGVNGITVPVGDIDKMAKALVDIRKIHIKEKFLDINRSENQILELFNNI